MHTIIGFISYGFKEKDGFDNAVGIAEKIWNKYEKAVNEVGPGEEDEIIGPPIFDGCAFFDKDQTRVGGGIFLAMETISKVLSKGNVIADPGGWGEDRYGKFPAVMRADSKEAKEFIDYIVETEKKAYSDDEYWYRGFIGKDGHIDNMEDLKKALIPSRPHFLTFIIPADIHF